MGTTSGVWDVLLVERLLEFKLFTETAEFTEVEAAVTVNCVNAIDAVATCEDKEELVDVLADGEDSDEAIDVPELVALKLEIAPARVDTFALNALAVNAVPEVVITEEELDVVPAT